VAIPGWSETAWGQRDRATAPVLCAVSKGGLLVLLVQLLGGCGKSTRSEGDAAGGAGNGTSSGGVSAGGVSVSGGKSGSAGNAGAMTRGGAPGSGGTGEAGRGGDAGAAGAAGVGEGGDEGDPPCDDGAVRCLADVGVREHCSGGVWEAEARASSSRSRGMSVNILSSRRRKTVPIVAFGDLATVDHAEKTPITSAGLFLTQESSEPRRDGQSKISMARV
jgi:hypothetical protein